MLLRTTSCIYCQIKGSRNMVPDCSSLPFSVFYSTLFPTNVLFLTTLALVFPHIKFHFFPIPRLQVLFFWKCSSRRPAWLLPPLFELHQCCSNNTIKSQPLSFLLLLKGTWKSLSSSPLSSLNFLSFHKKKKKKKGKRKIITSGLCFFVTWVSFCACKSR